MLLLVRSRCRSDVTVHAKLIFIGRRARSYKGGGGVTRSGGRGLVGVAAEAEKNANIVVIKLKKNKTWGKVPEKDDVHS